MGLAYSLRCQVGNHSKMVKILNEIKSRDPNLDLTTVLDFSCKTAINYHAINYVFRKNPKEWFYHGVDKNRPLIDLAEKFVYPGNIGTATNDEIRQTNIRNGITFDYQLDGFNKKANPNNKYYVRKYDIVIVNDCLWDLPSNEDRYKKLFNLWAMTGKYLVILDKGTKEGHMLIQLARAFILSKGRYIQKPQQVFGQAKEFEDGYTFAPCPHDLPCQNKSACTFHAKTEYKHSHSANLGLEVDEINVGNNYTYLIMKKGDRMEELYIMNEKMRNENEEFAMRAGSHDPLDLEDDDSAFTAINLEKAMKFKSLKRKDTKEINGELPWPRLLTNIGRKYTKDEYEKLPKRNGRLVYKNGMLQAAKICLPTGRIYEGNIHRNEINSNSFNILKHAKFGDRLHWFNFNNYMQFEHNRRLLNFKNSLIINESKKPGDKITLYQEQPKGSYKEFDKNSLPQYWQRLRNKHPLFQTPYLHGEIYNKSDLPLAARHNDRTGGFKSKLSDILQMPQEDELMVAENLQKNMEAKKEQSSYKIF